MRCGQQLKTGFWMLAKISKNQWGLGQPALFSSGTQTLDIKGTGAKSKLWQLEVWHWYYDLWALKVDLIYSNYNRFFEDRSGSLAEGVGTWRWGGGPWEAKLHLRGPRGQGCTRGESWGEKGEDRLIHHTHSKTQLDKVWCVYYTRCGVYIVQVCSVYCTKCTDCIVQGVQSVL